MNYPLRYYFDEGFLSIVYWTNTDPNTIKRHPFIGVFIPTRQITVSTSGDGNDDWTITVEGITYKLDENFYLDYGVFFHTETEGRAKAAEIVDELNSAAREYVVLAKPQLVDAEL
jgi:hypothetical protein